LFADALADYAPGDGIEGEETASDAEEEADVQGKGKAPASSKTAAAKEQLVRKKKEERRKRASDASSAAASPAGLQRKRKEPELPGKSGMAAQKSPKFFGYDAWGPIPEDIMMMRLAGLAQAEKRPRATLVKAAGAAAEGASKAPAAGGPATASSAAVGGSFAERVAALRGARLSK